MEVGGGILIKIIEGTVAGVNEREKGGLAFNPNTYVYSTVGLLAG